MPVIAEDDFERGTTVGQAPLPPWTIHVSADAGAAVDIQNDPAAGGTRGKVLRILDGTGASDYSEAKLVMPTTWSKICLVLEFYALSGSKKVYFGFYAGGSRYDLVALWTDGSIRYKRSSDSTFVALPVAQNYATGTWTRIRIVLDRTASAGELVAVTVAGVDGLTTALDLPSIPSDIQAIAVATDTTEDANGIYLNDVQILEKTGQITDVVRDQNGALVANARVVCFRQATLAKVGDVLTDSRGIYSISVESGVHYVVVAYHESLASRGAAVAPWVWGGAN